MGLKQVAYPLRIAPSQSSYLWALIVGAHALALVAIAIQQIPASLQLLQVALLGLSYWQANKRLGQPIFAIWNQNGSWQLTCNGKTYRHLALCKCGMMTTYIVWLKFRTADGARHLIVTRDMLDADTFRRLRVRLRVDTKK